jgi:hypothetical protein
MRPRRQPGAHIGLGGDTLSLYRVLKCRLIAGYVAYPGETGTTRALLVRSSARIAPFPPPGAKPSSIATAPVSTAAAAVAATAACCCCCWLLAACCWLLLLAAGCCCLLLLAACCLLLAAAACCCCGSGCCYCWLPAWWPRGPSGCSGD